LFKEDSREPQSKGYKLGFQPSQLLWDGDKIYLASKRAYVVMSKKDGALIFKYEIDNKGKIPSNLLTSSRQPYDGRV
jgi:hypothetical protein